MTRQKNGKEFVILEVTKDEASMIIEALDEYGRDEKGERYRPEHQLLELEIIKQVCTQATKDKG